MRASWVGTQHRAQCVEVHQNQCLDHDIDVLEGDEVAGMTSRSRDDRVGEDSGHGRLRSVEGS